jgi:Uma2 family endonuclease
MTTAVFSDGKPMTDAEFVAIGESPERIELFDGSLHVTPAPTPRHQYVMGELFVALRQPARERGLGVVLGPNVRLRPNRIPIPDLVVTTKIDYGNVVIDASAVLLACEVTSPSNAATDRVLKMHYYAEAGIPWYLLVEQDTATLHLFRLTGSTYAEHAVTPAGAVLHLREPVSADIDPAELLPPR